ncbi:acyl-CoA N-acyltransferase [Basidiobolus meristosporus CBS 931.73]|uniref:Acyl-CoA N-acyltransferase n=1 Tax=Basidiobolus meristosporus CBS 931.73 TaxID=1314790 RepID=A0A1Y1XWP3_9FUNG|nr:acyl-CoA N-acyltransferase [Basidiobolus meristosporus CBS 931.73]|eukprot:ORX90095.1 acyl-CoA N-acyltransferase [Basidiobolus meristosporus CBS 931.73]
MTRIETNRLRLVPIIEEDIPAVAEFFLQLNLDKKFTKMAWGQEEPIHATLEEVTNRAVQWKEAFEKFGMGWYFVRLRETQEPIGYVFIRPVLESQLQYTRDSHPEVDPATFQARPGEIELGYGFATVAWGKGYATEAVRRILDHGFQNLNVPFISGAALTDNVGSQKVMEKAGMTEIKSGGPSYYGVEDKYYEMTRKQWEQKEAHSL